VLTREATHEARWRQEHTPGRVGVKPVYLVVPKTGHPMGLQNPEGLAQAVAEALSASWPR
jgi:hypothetical protein